MSRMKTRPWKIPGLLIGVTLLIWLRPEAGAKPPNSSADPGGHTNRGVRFARDKQYDKAVEEFTKAIELQPNDAKNYRNRAQAYRLNNQPDKAVADYSKLIELAPDDAGAFAAR